MYKYVRKSPHKFLLEFFWSRKVVKMPKNPFGLPDLFPSKPNRDIRRSFAAIQKKEILYSTLFITGESG